MRWHLLSLGLSVLSLALLGSCVDAPSSSSSLGTESTSAASESESGSTESGSTETATETETETGEPATEVSVKWIEVAASDYKLPLDPAFDDAITEYTALADGPDITVYVDVIVTADVDAILVNDVPATLVGFRTWRSVPDTGLVSPTFATVEVVAQGARVPVYTIDVITP